MYKPMFTIIVAKDAKDGIGKDGKIPWKCSEDMKFFAKTTTGSVVIMGRGTYESIGKPLPNRHNLIISKTLTALDQQINTDQQKCQIGAQEKEQVKDLFAANNMVKFFADPMECVRYCAETYKNTDKKLFVIGGADIYRWFADNQFVSDAYVTHIDGNFHCDRFYHDDRPAVKKIIDIYGYHTDSKIDAMVYHYAYANKEEQNMLDLMNKILTKGRPSADRTTVGTLSLFGEQLKFDLRNNMFPLMTTKKMFLRGIFAELMLYLRGQTDNNILVEQGVNVWTPNTTREFLDKNALQDLPIGDMGHSYGFSFRHFGANYIDCKTDYNNLPKEQQGYDQLMELIKEIKTNPTSRRLIISLWEPNHMHRAALPPCLYNYQFDVDQQTKELSCMMTQRSSDFFLAGGWNVATGALLTIMLADVCGLSPGDLIWNIGNVHIYKNLIRQSQEQILRVPYTYPKLYLKKHRESIVDFEYEDLELIGYKSHASIKGVMNA